MNEITRHNLRTITAFLIYDLLPAILVLALIVFVTMKIPVLLVGIVIGYIACKYHAKLLLLKELYVKKISEMKSKYEDDL